ncbi:MAG: SulP family inorganic anion transporter [Tepidimonas sp.]|uniref:SulP family inorganic anion transporter n=1 Tax=Tepidimonas sp. TaxID=2002775 RepID=UPI00259D4042|nr:SulP family inorganic anion transporter [Tepidimonas sp.]MDM7457252.1 SulP family inorganic anion transporter [Tepidimonas sp.]
MAGKVSLSLLARFQPRLLQDLRAYSRDRLIKDVGAGLTVGIVALPLAMAFAIASGLPPQAGLWTAIIAGFVISALGGTSVQIGGPAGAFIVIVYGIVERYGVGGLLVSTLCAGVLLFVMGLLRLGVLVRFVPVSVVIGFTNGIAVLIGLSQLRDALGLQVAKMPADFFGILHAVGSALSTLNPYAVALAGLCVLGLAIWPRLWATDSAFRQRLDKLEGVSALRATSRLPAPVVALATLSLLAWALDWPVETIGSRFGGIPQALPALAWPDTSWQTVRQLVTPTLTIALLGAIESLLCARVADQLQGGRKHDPNQELMAQGIANTLVPFFGGMPATGTIARTVTNIRSGATSGVAGMVHAITLAAIVLLAAPLARHVPLAVLAGILLFVAWNMGEWREFARLRHFSHHYRLKLLSTFAVTVVFDLTVAVELGLVLAVVLFVRRQSSLFRVTLRQAGPQRIEADLYGSLFFGAVTKLDPLLQAIEAADTGVQVHLDAQHMMLLDSTGLDALIGLHDAIARRGGRLVIDHLHDQPLSLMRRTGFLAQLGGWSSLAPKT